MSVDPLHLQSIFTQALELSDPAVQDELAARLCGGDAELQLEVMALLAAHRDPQPLPGRPTSPPDFSATPLLPEAKPDAFIGRFKLLEQIGEGGMGVVWMAEQRSPVRRLVALKLIKAGMDSKSVLARFEAERQALAMMDHPSIARVLDGGVTDRGHPWFAMELVRGLPLTEYCDARRMSIRQRLDVFLQICSAAQHAHQKGIIHRDLKPSNVLVTELDGRPLPKIIDFGLAKALGGGAVLTDRTLHTSYGAAAGTILYMAPEQAGFHDQDVDTRADVYALGVILYELLTGSTPLERQQLADAGWDEVRRVIREEEPPLPSLRISRSNTLASLAATRHIEPARLPGLIKGDLDWIVLKALEKDRNRRYETAAGLAADVGRHLADEPVTAAPPSLVYRSQKFVRKHRGPVLAAAAVAAALVLGLVGTGVMTLRYREATAEAATRADDERHARQSAEQASYAANLSASQMSLAVSNYPEARRRLASCPAPLRGWEWGFLNEHAQSVVTQIPGQCEWSLDGSRIAAKPTADTLRFYASDGTPVGPIHEAGEFVLTFGDYDASWLVTQVGQRLQIWDAQQGRLAREIEVAVNYPSRKFGFGLDKLNDEHTRLITWTSDGLIQQWDRIGNQVAKPIEAGAGCFAQYEFEPELISIYLPGGKIQLWDPSGNPVTKVVDAGVDRHSSISRLGQERFATCSDGRVTLWSANGEHVFAIPGSFDEEDEFYEFSENGEVLLTISENEYQLWNSDGQKIGEPLAIDDADWASEFSKDGRFLVTQSKGGNLRWWNTATGEPVSPVINAPSFAGNDYGVEFSANNELVTFYGTDVIANRDRLLEKELRHRGAEVQHAGITPDGKAILVISGDFARLWSLDLKPISEPVEIDDDKLPVAESMHVKWVSNNRMFVVYTDKVLRVLSSACQPITPIIKGGSSFHGDKFDWQQVAVYTDKSCQLWDLQGKRRGPAIPGDVDIESSDLLASSEIGVQAYSTDGLPEGELMRGAEAAQLLDRASSLFASYTPGAFSLRDRQGPRGRFQLPWRYDDMGDSLEVPVARSPDGTHFAIEMNSFTKELCPTFVLPADHFGSPLDVPGDSIEQRYLLELVRLEPSNARTAQAEIIATLTADGRVQSARHGHDAELWTEPSQPLGTVCLSHDGTRLATGGGGDDRTVRIWEPASRRELASFQATDRVTALEFSPADSRLIVTLEGGGCEIWDSRPHAVRQAEREALWKERTALRSWADGHVANLLKQTGDGQIAAQRIAEDAALSPAQRFVAHEALEHRLAADAAEREWAQYD